VTLCSSCNHPRLLHDSWGCRAKCDCGVSIIYLTPGPLGDGTLDEQKTVLEQGKMFDRGSDRLGESLIRAMYDRVIAEVATEQGR
jgi:hypothetical protein